MGESGTVKMDMDGTLTTVEVVEKVVDEKIVPKRDYNDISYYATSETYSAYTHGISTFKIATTWDNIGEQTTNAPTVSANTTTWALDDGLGVLTSDGSTFYFQQSGSAVGSSFTMNELKAGAVRRVVSIGAYEGINVTANANFFKTEFALKDALPSKTSDLVNDSGFITASAVPSKVSELDNDVGYITASAIPSSYSSISDANGNVITASGAVTWQVPTYAWTMNLGWDIQFDQPEEIIRMSGTKTDSVGFSNEETAKYTLTFDGTSTWTLTRFNFNGLDWYQDGTWTKTGNEGTSYLTFSDFPEQNTIVWDAIPVTTQDTLATKSELPSKTSDLLNDSGFITASSSSFTNKRDYDDLTHPGSVYPSETHRIRQFDLNIEGRHNPRRYTLNKFSTNVPNYGSMWANDEEYWNFAVATSNGEDFTFNKYGAGGEVATFTMSDVTAGAITFTMTDDEIEYTCHLSASMYETTLALKDYVDANCASYSYVNSNLNVSGIGCSTITMSGVYTDTTTFNYNVVIVPAI